MVDKLDLNIRNEHNECRIKQDGRMVLWAEKQTHGDGHRESGRTRLDIIPVTAVDSPCIAIPDPQTEDEVRRGNTDSYLFILPRHQWVDVFETRMSEASTAGGGREPTQTR